MAFLKYLLFAAILSVVVLESFAYKLQRRETEGAGCTLLACLFFCLLVCLFVCLRINFAWETLLHTQILGPVQTCQLEFLKC